jgi:hypothetical protein
MLAKKFALAVALALVFPTMIDHAVRTISAPPLSGESNPGWQEKEKQFERALFYVAVPCGLIAIVSGALLSKQAAGAGLMFGGVFCALDGYYNYWDGLPYAEKFISLLIIFAVLMAISFTRLEKAPG